ncbi:hypothetical protein SXCC_00888 [Gluconacetobacter sp. SXCC-1]|nr:hypothetical protein SXCC_00888 [Gluconacetobacter sp. SXCC-1]
MFFQNLLREPPAPRRVGGQVMQITARRRQAAWPYSAMRGRNRRFRSGNHV